jgi:prevent-host-death family protein
MRRPTPDVPTTTISDLETRLRDLVHDVARRDVRIVVEDNGAPVAALVPLNDLRRLLRLDEIDREAHEVLEAMRTPFDDVPTEEIERQTERIMAEIREEDRAARERITRSA